MSGLACSTSLKGIRGRNLQITWFLIDPGAPQLSHRLRLLRSDLKQGAGAAGAPLAGYCRIPGSGGVGSTDRDGPAAQRSGEGELP